MEELLPSMLQAAAKFKDEQVKTIPSLVPLASVQGIIDHMEIAGLVVVRCLTSGQLKKARRHVRALRHLGKDCDKQLHGGRSARGDDTEQTEGGAQ